MSFWDMMYNEVMSFWYKRKNTIMLGIAFVVVMGLLSACSNPPPRPSLNSGEIIQIVKHDDVEIKDKVCTRKVTEKVKVNGAWKKRTVCRSYKTVTIEVTPEWYEFELKSGDKTGWTGRLDEATGEAYQKGDQYP